MTSSRPWQCQYFADDDRVIDGYIRTSGDFNFVEFTSIIRSDLRKSRNKGDASYHVLNPGYYIPIKVDQISSVSKTKPDNYSKLKPLINMKIKIFDSKSDNYFTFRLSEKLFDVFLNYLAIQRQVTKVSDDVYSVDNKPKKHYKSLILHDRINSHNISRNIVSDFNKSLLALGINIDKLFETFHTRSNTTVPDKLQSNTQWYVTFDQNIHNIDDNESYEKFTSKDFEDMKKSYDNYEYYRFRRKLYFAEVDDSIRPDLWFYLLEIDVSNPEKIKDDYIESVERVIAMTCEDLDKDPVLAEAFSLIDKDSIRTDRNMELFKPDDHIESLKRILKCYYLSDQNFGYAQGMNDVLAVVFSAYHEKYKSDKMLLEAICLKVFKEIFHKFLLEYYQESGYNIKLAFSHISYMLYALDSNLLEHIQSANINSFAFCLPWIMMLFKRIYYNNYNCVFSLWDSIFCNYWLQMSQSMYCKNLLLVFSAALILQMKSEYLKHPSDGIGEEAVRVFLDEENRDLESSKIYPRKLKSVVSKIYEAHWVKGYKSDIFGLLFDLFTYDMEYRHSPLY